MNEVQEEGNPLSQDFDIKSLLKFALPTIIMMLLMGLYTIVDTIFVARFVGTNALSALNIVCPVINLIVGLGTMLATGGSAIVARKMGAGETVRASQDFTLIIGAGALFGVSPVCRKMLLKYGRDCRILSGCLLPRQIRTRKAEKARKHGTFGTT